jgi:hypothetical protein
MFLPTFSIKSFKRARQFDLDSVHTPISFPFQFRLGNGKCLYRQLPERTERKAPGGLERANGTGLCKGT